MIDMKIVGANIRANRKRRKMSQAKLGQLVGVTQKTISAWECGTRNPAVYGLSGIAKALGILRDDLFVLRK